MTAHTALPSIWKVVWAHPGKSSPLFAVTLAAAIALGVIVRINVALKHRFPQGDEGPWLRCAASVGTDSFMVSTVLEHDMDPHRLLPRPEDNRSPLYPVLIAAVGVFAGDLMQAGQVLNLLFFIALCLTIAAVLRRSWGKLTAVIAVVFLSCSPHFILYTAQIYPDILVALGFLTIVNNGHGFLRSGSRAALGGLLLGLLVLLKTTGLLALPALIAHAWTNRTAGRTMRSLLIAFIVMSACILPWAARNARHFGSPFYQAASTTLFTDRMDDVFRVGIERPHLASYVAEKGLLFVAVVRPAVGLARLVRDASTFDHGLSLFALPLVIAGAWSVRKRRRAIIPVLVFTAAYLPFMAYVAYGSWVGRYTLIFYIWTYALAAIGCGTLGRALSRKTVMQGTTAVGCALVVLTTAVYPLEFHLSPRGSEHERDRSARAIIDVATRIVPDSGCVLSSFASSYSHRHRMKVVNRLLFSSWRDIESVATNYSITHALLDSVADRDLLGLIAASGGTLDLRALARNGPFVFYCLNVRVPGIEPGPLPERQTEKPRPEP